MTAHDCTRLNERITSKKFGRSTIALNCEAILAQVTSVHNQWCSELALALDSVEDAIETANGPLSISMNVDEPDAHLRICDD